MARTLLTTGEVAEAFRVRPPTILRWLEAKTIAAVGRRPVRRGGWLFSQAEVDRLMALNAQPVEPVDVRGKATRADIEAIIASECRRRPRS